MKKPKSLSPEVVELFYPLLEAEYEASYFYKNAANYCKIIGYFKANKFFNEESLSELGHAAKLQEYLCDWNVMPELHKIDEPRDFKGLIDVIEAAYAMEYKLYEAYDSFSLEAFKMGETAVFDFFQEFRLIQTQAVAEYSDMLNILEGVENDKFKLLLLEKIIFNG